jgi:RNA 3'-terminal phosphate cyclase (ATP)
MLTMAHEHVTETVTGFGQRGISAEAVASGVASIADQYLKSSAAAGAYLSDQLLLPMALAGGGRFTALRLTRHAVTNIDTIQKMLEVRISREQTKGSEAEIVTIASA